MDYEQALQKFDVVTKQLIAYFSNKSNSNKLKKIIAISAATYLVTSKLYIGFFGPLSRIPGPFYTRFFRKPIFLVEAPQGTGYQEAKHKHEKYGDIVRVGPDVVSVATVELAKQVLITDNLTKGPIYDRLRDGNRPNLFTSTDKDWHKNRRRIVSSAFSVRYLNSLEPYMMSCTKTFVHQIDKDIETTKDKDGYGTVDLWSLIQRLAVDVIGETAFGQSFQTIENSSHPIPDAIAEMMRTGGIRAMVPLLSKILLFKTEDPHPFIQKFLRDIIEERLRDKSKERNDILQYLINSQKSNDENDRLDVAEISEETVLFLIAGSETTSNTTGFAFFELLKHPDKLEKLHQEIDSVDLNEDGAFHNEQLKHLPYLNAVINETLRLDPVAAGALHRYTTQPTVLGNMVLPKNTHVLVNTYHIQTNEKYWPNPFEFIPERWTEETDLNELEANIPFSLGSRNCIGRNFALQEMRLSIATVLKHFDIKPIPSEMKDGEVRRQFVTLRIAKNSFSVKIKRRQ